jgi:hypothetical protein
LADPVLDAGYDPLSDGAVRDGRRAIRPRDAATLILVRRNGEPRLLMGRRHGGHAFMPSKWVFPGGGVDRSDARAPSTSELDAATAAGSGRAAEPWPWPPFARPLKKQGCSWRGRAKRRERRRAGGRSCSMAFCRTLLHWRSWPGP